MKLSDEMHMVRSRQNKARVAHSENANSHDDRYEPLMPFEAKPCFISLAQHFSY